MTSRIAGHAMFEWWRRGGASAVVVAVLGALAVVGVGAGLALGLADGRPGPWALLAGLGCVAVALRIARIRRRDRLIVPLFASGVLVGLLIVAACAGHVMDWYNVRECERGIPKACLEAISQGSRQMGTADREVFRKGCELGVAQACASQLKHSPDTRVETCRAIEAICDGRVSAVGMGPDWACQERRSSCPDP